MHTCRCPHPQRGVCATWLMRVGDGGLGVLGVTYRVPRRPKTAILAGGPPVTGRGSARTLQPEAEDRKVSPPGVRRHRASNTVRGRFGRSARRFRHTPDTPDIRCRADVAQPPAPPSPAPAYEAASACAFRPPTAPHEGERRSPFWTTAPFSTNLSPGFSDSLRGIPGLQRPCSGRPLTLVSPRRPTTGT